MYTIMLSLAASKVHNGNLSSTIGPTLMLKPCKVLKNIYMLSLVQILKITNSRFLYVVHRSLQTTTFRRTFVLPVGGIRLISSSPSPKIIVTVRYRVGLFTRLNVWEFFSQLCLIAAIS